MLFSTVRRAGVRVRHHGDFDETGVQIFRDLEASYDALLWRFDIRSLCDALGPRAPAQPPNTLEAAVKRLSCGVAEERVMDDLIADLGNARS
jgi:hypothetical protein